MSKYIQAQKLNRRITIQRKTGERDTLGQPIDQWVTVCRLYADVKFQTGMGMVNQEFQTGGTEVSRAVGSIRVRRRPGITADMRVLLGGFVFDIKVVLADEQDHRSMYLAVATGANAG